MSAVDEITVFPTFKEKLHAARTLLAQWMLSKTEQPKTEPEPSKWLDFLRQIVSGEIDVEDEALLQKLEVAVQSVQGTSHHELGEQAVNKYAEILMAKPIPS